MLWRPCSRWLGGQTVRHSREAPWIGRGGGQLCALSTLQAAQQSLLSGASPPPNLLSPL